MMSETMFLRARSSLWIASAGGTLLAVLIALFIAGQWPLVHDAPLLHYVIFLMDHGRAPYRDIVEINMPGSYMLEWTVMHTLGAGAHGWFAWDLLTGIAAICSAAAITGPERRAAGIVAGGLAYLFHLRDGAWDLGQRDWGVAVLLLAAFACVVHLLRARDKMSASPAWMGAAVCLCGVAASMKPPVVLVPFLLLAFVVYVSRRQGIPGAPYVLWSLAGAVPPLLATAGFLTYWHVWREFADALHGLVPYYAGLQPLPYSVLLDRAVPLTLMPFAVGGCLLFLATRSWRDPAGNLLLLGVAVGLGLFLLQRKGWSYHRYTLVAFLLVWTLVQIERALKSSSMVLHVGGAVLLLIMLFELPAHSLAIERSTTYPMELLNHLQDDLTQLGPAQLSGRVQCLDMALGGCINTLYRMHLQQSTGFIYDFALFPEHDTPLTRRLQARFLTEVVSAPPRVFILSSQIWPGERFGYDEIDRWPLFQKFLAARYTIKTHYQTDPSTPSIGYRLYVLNADTP